MTGAHTDDVDVRELRQPSMPANVIVFLAKPFKMKKLETAVRDCLATRFT